MSRYFSVIVVFSLLFSFSFAVAQNQVAEAKKYIEEINNKMESDMLEGNVDGMSEYYAEDVISLPSYEPMKKGRDKMMQDARKMHKEGYKFNSVQFKTVEVFGSGNHVYEIGEYDMSMVMPEMPQPMEDQGKYLTVWEKQSDGNWKVVAEMWNTNKNPWGNDNKDKEANKENRE